MELLLELLLLLCNIRLPTFLSLEDLSLFLWPEGGWLLEPTKRRGENGLISSCAHKREERRGKEKDNRQNSCKFPLAFQKRSNQHLLPFLKKKSLSADNKKNQQQTHMSSQHSVSQNRQKKNRKI